MAGVSKSVVCRKSRGFVCFWKKSSEEYEKRLVCFEITMRRSERGAASFAKTVLFEPVI